MSPTQQQQQTVSGVALLGQAALTACHGFAMAANLNVLSVIVSVARAMLDGAIKLVPADVDMSQEEPGIRKLYRAATAGRDSIDGAINRVIDVVGPNALRIVRQ